MSLKNARLVKYPEDFNGNDIIIRKLTPQEKELLLEQILERMSSDRLSDALAEIANELSQGQADSIVWD